MARVVSAGNVANIRDLSNMNADAHKENAEKFFSPAVTNEPTIAEKEAAFKFWLEKYWNEGPFTDTSKNSRMNYPTGFKHLDLGYESDHYKNNQHVIKNLARLYDYGVECNYFGLTVDGQRGNEMMMLEFILLDLADELGYELIELQNETHWGFYQKHKEQIEKEGWIPYDGKGMPEGLEEKQVCICCFGDQEWISGDSCFLKGKKWSWHAFDNEYKERAVYAISFYKVKEESEEQKPVGNQENDNV